MTVFILSVQRPAGPVLITVNDGGTVSYRGTKEKVLAVKTALRTSKATMHNLDDSKRTTPLRLVRKLFAIFGTGAYKVMKGQSRLTSELKREQEQVSLGRVL